MSLLYKLINPPVKALLKSPFHSVVSSNTLLLEFEGRKSGRPLSTPISYHIREGVAYGFTSREFGWWRNLKGGQTVSATIKGKKYQCAPVVETEDHLKMESELKDFLLTVPRDAAHAGVRLDQDGNPNTDDIKQVVPGMVLLKLPLNEGS